MRRLHLNVIVLIVSLLTVSTMAAVLAVSASSARVSPAEPACASQGFDADCLETEPVGRQYSAKEIQEFEADLTSSPERLVIKSQNVDSRVVPVGMTKNRALEIPENIEMLGWYRYSARPASSVGAMVLVGHRDGVEQGKGALYDLANMQLGDTIEVTDTLNRLTKYSVIARSVISKDEFARRSPDIFSVMGPKRLRLISCGGYYDADQGGYQSNVIITAKPIA